jgi:hypothetical protein
MRMGCGRNFLKIASNGWVRNKAVSNIRVLLQTVNGVRSVPFTDFKHKARRTIVLGEVGRRVNRKR